LSALVATTIAVEKLRQAGAAVTAPAAIVTPNIGITSTRRPRVNDYTANFALMKNLELVLTRGRKRSDGGIHPVIASLSPVVVVMRSGARRPKFLVPHVTPLLTPEPGRTVDVLVHRFNATISILYKNIRSVVTNTSNGRDTKSKSNKNLLHGIQLNPFGQIIFALESTSSGFSYTYKVHFFLVQYSFTLLNFHPAMYLMMGATPYG
jgi:hypothetical protein